MTSPREASMMIIKLSNHNEQDNSHPVTQSNSPKKGPNVKFCKSYKSNKMRPVTSGMHSRLISVTFN